MSTNSTTTHAVTLKLSIQELQELGTLASHYELSEGDFITLALRHFIAELDSCLIPA